MHRSKENDNFIFIALVEPIGNIGNKLARTGRPDNSLQTRTYQSIKR